MKIGILSDSHRSVDKNLSAVELLVKNGAKYLVHAGDFGVRENLVHLKESGLGYVVVFGNNDYHLIDLANEFNIKQEPYYFKIENTTFKLMHLPYYLSPDSDVVIYGHTHMFEVDKKVNTLYINSGEVCARNKSLSEVSMLEIFDNKYEVTYYYRNIDENEWKTKKVSFDK